jgi:hypothetical protein
LAGEAAIAEYVRLEASPFLVIPEEVGPPPLPAFRISSGELPRFQDSGLDVLVWPEDLSWTMAFTHEEGWLGPYYCRREWIGRVLDHQRMKELEEAVSRKLCRIAERDPEGRFYPSQPPPGGIYWPMWQAYRKDAQQIIAMIQTAIESDE